MPRQLSTFPAVKVLNMKSGGRCVVGVEQEAKSRQLKCVKKSKSAIVPQEEPGPGRLFCLFVIRSQMLFICQFVFLAKQS